MKKLISSGMLAAVILMTFTPAYSQVSVQWTRTLELEGYWEGPVTLTLAGQPFILNYYTEFKSAIDGAALTMEEGFSDPDLGELKGLNLIGFNPADGMIHWFSVDNFGTTHDHSGSWLNPNHFYMQHQSIQGSQTYTEYIHLRLKANHTRVELSLIATLDADTVQILDGTLYRQGNANRASDITRTEKAITIYPNPAEGRLTIASPNRIDEVRITGENGQLISHVKPASTEYTMDLDVAGIYFIQVTSDGETVKEKVIINK